MTNIKKIKLYKKVGEEFVFMQIFNSSKDCCEYGLSKEEVFSKIKSYSEFVLRKVLLHIEISELKIYNLKNLDLFNYYAK